MCLQDIVPLYRPIYVLICPITSVFAGTLAFHNKLIAVTWLFTLTFLFLAIKVPERGLLLCRRNQTTGDTGRGQTFGFRSQRNLMSCRTQPLHIRATSGVDFPQITREGGRSVGSVGWVVDNKNFINFCLVFICATSPRSVSPVANFN